MDYIFEANYGMYLLEQISEQKKMERYIAECIIMSEGTNVINKLQALNEGIGDTASEWWDKIKSFISRVWGKFMENFSKFANADRGYCEKYKEIILKKPLKEEPFPIKMRDCPVGVTRIMHSLMPIFSPNLLEGISTDDGNDNTTFKKKLINTYAPGTEFVDFAKDYFIGSKAEELKSFSATAIRMTDLYNFVVGFDKIKSNIEKDKNELLKGIDAIQKDMQKGSSTPKPAPTSTQPDANGGAPQKDANGNTVGAPQKTKPTQPAADGKNWVYKNDSWVQESSLFGNKKSYSVVYEQYITEVEYANKPASGGGSGTVTAPTNTTDAASKNNVDKAHDTSTEDERKTQLAKETDDSITEKGKVYYKFANNFLTAKMSAADFIEKEYMTLIRMHVVSYVGNEDKTANKGTDSETNQVETVPPVTDKTAIASVTAAIKNAEDHKPEDDDKTALKRAAVIAVRNATGGKFTGDYEAAKTFMNYK